MLNPHSLDYKVFFLYDVHLWRAQMFSVINQDGLLYIQRSCSTIVLTGGYLSFYNLYMIDLLSLASTQYSI